MKLSLIHLDDEYSEIELSVYIPSICFNKEIKPQVGEIQRKTTIDIPTKISIINTKSSLKWILVVMGVGVSIYIREKL